MGLKDLLNNNLTGDKMDTLMDGLVDSAGDKIVGILKKIGPVPDDLVDKIMTEKNKDVLADWLKKAMQSASIDDFKKKIQK